MTTPFTEASTFFVTIEGKTVPVVSADAARVMEIRMDAALKSQSSAWNIIAAANWKSQSDDWKTLARHWQNHTYVQPELPLPFPPHSTQSGAGSSDHSGSLLPDRHVGTLVASRRITPAGS